MSSVARKHTMIGLMYRQFLRMMMCFSIGAAVLILTRIYASDSQRYAFLMWNLFLAWIPAAVALWFTRVRRRTPRLQTVALFLAWLFFLPNTFYVLSDFIHLSRVSGDFNILYDVVMLFVFTCIGFLLGLSSMGIMHLWLRRYINKVASAFLILAIIFLCSFAIYLGRYLRWNSWDVLLNPFGILVDVSDRVISPLDHPRTLSITLLFFALIGSAYAALWWLADFYFRMGSHLFGGTKTD